MAKTLKKKTKLKLLPFFVALIFLALLVFIANLVLKIPTSNIVILGNDRVSDQEIIDAAGISEYPSFYKTSSNSIKRKVLANPYIKAVTVKKKFYHILEITVSEYKLLYQREVDKKIILENGEELLSEEINHGIPILLNYVPDTKQASFLEGMTSMKEEVRKQVSEIVYVPNDYDKDRFLLTINDGNSVYLTLTKFHMINYYDEVLPQLEGRKGVLYLDSGNHFQIME